ncbi:zinc-dependent alcohol dehydrogenase family protein [Actinoallomurus purpureus]|uniref:zinc-dependent alcohol dehydrogenase family protein n=1 Tax=Actinoallomurus purpureus TaxID=478114 RepID=UPI0020931A5F|nr:zinc-dependent alcohol dehydrogenase family protein [Actinoallomurus purpureus]MCO6004159.1 zinc-dependent alcohol dehydrogenase family protein [Actinoallomurus purpureus]
MRAAVISTPGSLSVQTVKDPEPGPGQIVVAPRAVGVCGTDLHILDGEFPPTPYPIIPGHEFSGEVVALGPGVTGVAAGDRVAVDPSLFCGHCVYCRRQRGNLCLNWNAIGDTVNGAFAEYVAVPAANAYPLPGGMSYAAGALVEPLACVVHGLRRLAIPPGGEVLIIGAGTIGLLLAQAAARSGAARVSMVDTDPARLERAAKLGADVVATGVEEVLAGRGIGFEHVIDATGVPAATQAALPALCRGGTLLVFGVSPAEARLPISPFQVYNDEISVIGSMAVLHTFEPALRLMASGAITAEDLITHQVPLERATEAFGVVRDRTGLKAQVTRG